MESNLKKTNYGWGQSMNLINNGTLCELSMWIDMYGNAGETAYASYQHARNSNVTLAISKAYTFSSSGLGGVLYWSNSTYSNYYDGMDGVVDTLSSGQHWDFHS